MPVTSMIFPNLFTPTPARRHQSGCLALAGLLMAVPDLSAQFTNATEQAGLVYQQMAPGVYGSTAIIESGGAAAGDYDGDGWVDLFVTRVGYPPILFRNRGPVPPYNAVQFEDVTEAAGITGGYNSNGAAWGDIDNDGDLDLYVTTITHARYYLYLNNGDGTFTEVAKDRGADLTHSLPHEGFSVSFGDYDNDGYLDFYVSEYYVKKDATTAQYHNSLMRNFGQGAPGYFTNQTQLAGVVPKGALRPPNTGLPYFVTFTTRFSDLDGDGWQDLLMVADYGVSQLFWNNGNGTFTDLGSVTGIGLEKAGMGCDVADYDGDGLLDWFVSSIDDCRLYRNLGGRRFKDVATTVGPGDGLTNAGWGWGSAFLDAENDGDLDLVMANGFEDRDGAFPIEVRVEQTAFWRNDNGVFNKESSYAGFSDFEPGKGLLTFDYDNDGDLDVFIVNCQEKPILYKNNSRNSNHWLRINLVGRKSNSQGIGARLELQATDGGPVKVREVTASSHFLSQSEVTAHFGLGSVVGPLHQLTVRWPSGRVQVLKDLPVDRELTIPEPVTYQEWETRLSSRTLPALGGKDNDFDLDGFSNFLEYLFASNPRDAAQRPDLDLIRPRISPDGSTFRYARPLGALDVKFVYEVSEDLNTWTEVGNSFETAEIHLSWEGDFRWVEVALPGNGTESRFLRIRVVEIIN